MPIIARGGSSDFVPCPAGVHQAVCCDVVDLGMLDTTFGQKHKISIRWQVAEDMENGKPFLVQKRYTLSLHEKSTLRHDLESWRGRAFTEAESEGFDVETLLGANCMLNVMHKKGDKGGTFANIAAVMPLAKNMPKMSVRGYVREIDRAPQSETNTYADAPPADDIAPSDDDIPF